MAPSEVNRRTFLERTAATGAVMTVAGIAAPLVKAADAARAPDSPQKKIRVGIIGCGSVSGVYLPHLM